MRRDTFKIKRKKEALPKSKVFYKGVKIKNKSKKKHSQIAKPIGFKGRITAQFMAIGHRAIYKNVK